MSDTGLIFTAPVKWFDGTDHEELRGSCSLRDDHLDLFGEPYVSFQDDYSVEGGECPVPLSKVPALIEWLQAVVEAHGTGSEAAMSDPKPVEKYGARDYARVGKVPEVEARLRATIKAAITQVGWFMVPDSWTVNVLEPLAEDDGTLTQEVRVAVLVVR